jgi:hypothetical protein
MNSSGRDGEKTGYLVILLLVVGLTAFSTAMKELSEIRELTLDPSRFVAQLSGNIVPAEISQTVVKLETCDSKQSQPAIELPWLAQDRIADVEDTERPVVVERARSSKAQVVRVRRVRRVDMDPAQFEVRISNDHDEPDEPIISGFPVSTFKAKTRKHGAIRISPRDREMFLKTLNRSINLRIAS